MSAFLSRRRRSITQHRVTPWATDTNRFPTLKGLNKYVETKNFKRETSLPGSSANTRLIERFTRTDANTLVYEFTVDDPTMWTRPWTAVVPMSKSEDPIYEYACHEGNHAMIGILAGARADEKAAEEAAKQQSK